MAKNYQMNTKDSQYKKMFKLDNRKKQSPSSAEIKGKSKSSMASAGSNMVLIDYNHAPGKVHLKQEIKDKKSDENSTNNDKYFSGYIDRVKNKMRTTTSSVGVDDDGGGIIRKAVTKRDSLNDRISHYIKRAKLKIRTTTIVERGDHI